MKKLTILKSKNNKLRIPSESISLKELRTKQMQQTIDAILEFVYGGNNKGEHRNINKPTTSGLSAVQCGILKRMTAVDLGIGHKSYGDLHVLINPIISWESKTRKERAEGCVNLVNTWGYISRSQRIKVNALDRSGNKISLDIHGWPAVLLQHEIDHMNGILFIDHLKNPQKAHLVKESEYREYKNLQRNWQKFIDVSSLAKPIK